MYKTVLTGVVLALIFVAFIGQAMTFSASIPCETLVDADYANNSDLENHQAESLLEADSITDCCGIECCDVDCTCVANACSPFAYFSTEVDPARAVALNEGVYIQQFKQPNSIFTSLYRPPIFTS